MATILWTEPAIKDLESIHTFIARNSKFYADAFVANLIQKTESLQQFPLLGRIVPEIGDEHTRELLVENYRVVYDVNAEVVRILAVIHSSREFPIPG